METQHCARRITAILAPRILTFYLLQQQTTFTHSHSSLTTQKNELKDIRSQGRNRVKEMETRRRETMRHRAEEVHQQRLDEVFDENVEDEEEEARDNNNNDDEAPISTNPAIARTNHRGGVPRLSKAYTRDIAVPEPAQNMSDSSIIPSPGVPILSRRSLDKDNNNNNNEEDGGDEYDDDEFGGAAARVSKEEQELEGILLDVRTSLEAPLLTAPPPNGRPSPGVDIMPRAEGGGVDNSSFDVNQSAFNTSKLSVGSNRSNSNKKSGSGKTSPTVVKRQQWLERGKSYAQEQRERRKEVARKEREAKEEAETKRKARLLALDVNRRKLRTAPPPESAAKRIKAMRATFAEMEGSNRILPERQYSQEAFKVGALGDDVDQAASEALRGLASKEEIKAAMQVQQRMSAGRPPLDPQEREGVSGTILGDDEGETTPGFDMHALLSKEEEDNREDEKDSDDETASTRAKGKKTMASPAGSKGGVAASSKARPASASVSNRMTSRGGVSHAAKAALGSKTKTARPVPSRTTRPSSLSSSSSLSPAVKKMNKTAPAAAPDTKVATRALVSAPKKRAVAGTATKKAGAAIRGASKERKSSSAASGGAKKEKEIDTLDLLEQSDIVVSRPATTSASASSAIARRKAAAEKAAAAKDFSARGKKPVAATVGSSAPGSASPTRGMERGNAFPTHTRAGGFKTGAEKARGYLTMKKERDVVSKSREAKEMAEAKEAQLRNEEEEAARALANVPGHKLVQEAGARLTDLTTSLGMRVATDVDILQNVDVTDPEQVKARLAVEMSNRMFYQRDSLRDTEMTIPAGSTGVDGVHDDMSAGVYEDTGSHDSDLENSATLDKPPSPSAARRPVSSYGKRSPESPTSSMGDAAASRFGFGGSAEGLVAMGSSPGRVGKVTATSTAPMSPDVRVALGISMNDDGDNEVAEEQEVPDQDLSGSGHDASFEVEESDDVILEDDLPDISNSSPTRSVKSVGALEVSAEEEGDVSELISDPLAGDFAEYINTVGSGAGTSVAAQMMEMPRSRSAAAATAATVHTLSSSTSVSAVAGESAHTSAIKVVETEREDVMDELERMEKEHEMEMKRVAAANRGSDYVSPFDPIPNSSKNKKMSPSDMKAQDDADDDLRMGMDMIADRRKLSQAFDSAAERAQSGFDRAVRTAGADDDDVDEEEDGVRYGQHPHGSTPEDVKKTALADIHAAEQKAKFKVDGMDIQSLREKRRMDIEDAVRKEREKEAQDPYRGPSLRNRGALATELSQTYDPRAGGSGLEDMDAATRKQLNKNKSWHQQVQDAYGDEERREAYLEEERKRNEEDFGFLDDSGEEEDEDDTQAVVILAKELTIQKETLRQALIDKHTASLKEQASHHAKIAADEEEKASDVFADALIASNAIGAADKENVGGNTNVNATVCAATTAAAGTADPSKSGGGSFWDSFQHVRSPMERRYNPSDPPEDTPIFEGVDMESVLLQSLMIAHQPDEWLRRDKERREGFDAKREIKGAIDKARGNEEVNVDNVLSVAGALAGGKAAAAAGGGAVDDGNTAPAAPARLSPSELRAKMAAELKRQEEIHGYALELAEMEQAQAVQSASQVVEKVMQQAGQDVGEIQRQQEMALQQQAYELSLTTAVNSVQAALAQETAKHQAKVRELELQLQRQELTERELRSRAATTSASASTQRGGRGSKQGGRSSSPALRRDGAVDRETSIHSSNDGDDYSAVFENDSQISGVNSSPMRGSVNRSIPSILDDIHASGDYGDDASTAYSVDEASQLPGSNNRRYRDDSMAEVEEDDSIRRSGGSRGAFSESEYSDVFDELDPQSGNRAGSSTDDADDSMSVSGSGSINDAPSHQPFSGRPSLSASPTRAAAKGLRGNSPTPLGARSSTSIGSTGGVRRSDDSDARSNVKFHQDTRSPKRRTHGSGGSNATNRRGPVASSLDSAVTMLSAEDRLSAGAAATGDSSSVDVTAKMLGEYRTEMESRLRSQDKALKMRTHFLKTRRSHRLAVIEEKRQRMLSKNKGDKDSAARKALRTLDKDEEVAKAEYEEARAELERERWTLNARAYRELRKFNSLKKDVEATSMRGFLRGEAPSPATPERPGVRGSGGSVRDRSWARSKHGSSNSDGYSSLESSPSSGSSSSGNNNAAAAGGGASNKVIAATPTGKAAREEKQQQGSPNSESPSSSGSGSSAEKDPNGLSVSMLTTRSVLSTMTASAEKPPLGRNGKGATTPASEDKGIAIPMSGTSPSSRAVDESTSLSESAIKATIKAAEKPQQQAVAPPTPGTPHFLQNSTDTLEELERSIEVRSRRVESLRSNLETMQSRESRLAALKERQEEKSKLIALERDLALRLSSEQLYSDLSATQIKRLAAAGALPKELLPPPGDDEDDGALGVRGNAALAALRASAENSLVLEESATADESEEAATLRRRLARLSPEDRTRVHLLTKAISATEPMEDEVAEEEMDNADDSWDSRDSATSNSMQYAAGAGDVSAASIEEGAMGGLGIAEGGGTSPSHKRQKDPAAAALTSRIVREAAAVQLQAAYRMHAAGKRYRVIQQWNNEAKSEAAVTAGGAYMPGDVVHEHRRLVASEDKVLDDSWASTEESEADNSGLFDPEDDDAAAGMLGTAVHKLQKAIRARDDAEQAQAAQERQEEEQRVADSIKRYSEAATAAEKSAQDAQDSVRALDERINAALHRGEDAKKEEGGGVNTSSHSLEHSQGSIGSKSGGGKEGKSPSPRSPKYQLQQPSASYDDDDGSSVEFSVGDPESLPASNASSPRNRAIINNKSNANTNTNTSTTSALDSSVSTLGDNLEKSELLSAVSASPAKQQHQKAASGTKGSPAKSASASSSSSGSSFEDSEREEKKQPPQTDLPTALEQSYSSVQSAVSNAAGSISSSFDASASIGAMEAAQRRADAKDAPATAAADKSASASVSGSWEVNEGEDAEKEGEERVSVSVPPPIAAAPEAVAAAAAAVVSSRDGSLVNSHASEDDFSVESSMEEDVDVVQGEKEDEEEEDFEVGEPEAPVAAPAEEEVEEVIEESMDVSVASHSSASGEQLDAAASMVPPTQQDTATTPTSPDRNVSAPSSPEKKANVSASASAPSTPDRSGEPVEEGLTAVESSPTKVVTAANANAKSTGGTEEESAASALDTASASSAGLAAAGKDSSSQSGGASGTHTATTSLAMSQTDTVAWGDAAKLPSINYSDTEPTAGGSKNEDAMLRESRDSEAGRLSTTRFSAESTLTTDGATPRGSIDSQGGLGDLTAISGISHPGSSIDSGSLISTASDVAALKAAANLQDSVDVSQESSAQKEEEEKVVEEEKKKDEEEEEESIAEELEESIEELAEDESEADVSALQDLHELGEQPSAHRPTSATYTKEGGDAEAEAETGADVSILSDTPSALQDLRELGELSSPTPKQQQQQRAAEQSVDSNSGLDISAHAAIPKTADDDDEEEEGEEKKEQEKEKEVGMSSLSGLPSLPAPVARPVVDDDEDLYEFDASPSPASGAAAAGGRNNKLGLMDPSKDANAADAASGAAAGALSPTSDGSDSRPAISTTLVAPVDWTGGVQGAAQTLLNCSDLSAISAQLQDPSFAAAGHAFFTPEMVEAARKDAAAAGDDVASDVMANGRLVADRFNEILVALHGARHGNASGDGGDNTKGGSRLGLGARFLAEVHPLSANALTTTLMESVLAQQEGVSAVLEGRRHFLEMVRVDAIDDFKRDYSTGLSAAADEITDILLARALVDTAQVLEEEIDDNEAVLLAMKEERK
jgi:hypothetical protein